MSSHRLFWSAARRRRGRPRGRRSSPAPRSAPRRPPSPGTATCRSARSTSAVRRPTRSASRSRPAPTGSRPGRCCPPRRTPGAPVGGEVRAGQPLQPDRRPERRRAVHPHRPGADRGAASPPSTTGGETRGPRTRACATGASSASRRRPTPAGLPDDGRAAPRATRPPAPRGRRRLDGVLGRVDGDSDDRRRRRRRRDDAALPARRPVPPAAPRAVDGHLHLHEHLPRAGEGPQGLRVADQRRPARGHHRQRGRRRHERRRRSRSPTGTRATGSPSTAARTSRSPSSGASGTVITDYDSTLECRSGHRRHLRRLGAHPRRHRAGR